MATWTRLAGQGLCGIVERIARFAIVIISMNRPATAAGGL